MFSILASLKFNNVITTYLNSYSVKSHNFFQSKVWWVKIYENSSNWISYWSLMIEYAKIQLAGLTLVLL